MPNDISSDPSSDPALMSAPINPATGFAETQDLIASSTVHDCAAVRQVTGTVELLEMILLNMDYIDIYAAACVSKHFRSVTFGSPSIRKALWLEKPAAKSRDSVNIMTQRLDSSDLQ